MRTGVDERIRKQIGQYGLDGLIFNVLCRQQR